MKFRNEKGQFEKGLIPWNKGRSYRLENHVNETSFKNGKLHPRYRPVGSERVNRDNLVEIKITDSKWMTKHRYVWELENGPVPKGHVIIFANGDKRDFSIDNLLLVSRAQLAQMNKANLIQNDTDLTKTGKILADLLLATGEAGKRVK